jgi:hypothetical protein
MARGAIQKMVRKAASGTKMNQSNAFSIDDVEEKDVDRPEFGELDEEH